MSIQRRGDFDFQAGVFGSGFANQTGKIALEVQTKREEVGNDHNMGNAARCQLTHGGRKIGPAAFEKCRDHLSVAASVGHFEGNRPHGFVRGFHARSVRKYYVAGHKLTRGFSAASPADCPMAGKFVFRKS